MKKYDLANYLNNKTAVIQQGEKGDYYDGKKWFVIFYDHGKVDWDYKGTKGTGEKVCDTENAALRIAINYIKENKK